MRTTTAATEFQMPPNVTGIEIDNEKIKNIDELSDRELVQRLKNGDNDAWVYVLLKAILPVVAGCTKNGIPYKSILKDKFLDTRDVYSDLFMEMIYRRKLDLYYYGCPLIKWMRIYVKNIILGYCKKIPSHVSDECLKYVSISKTAIREIAEVSEFSFAELWRKNPMRAYVFLLKNLDCYSSEEIKNFLNMSSNNSVDQCYKRAKEDMAELITQYSGEEK